MDNLGRGLSRVQPDKQSKVDTLVGWKFTSSFRITAVPADPVKPDTKALRLKHSEAYSLCIEGGSGVESSGETFSRAGHRLGHRLEERGDKLCRFVGN